MKYIKFFEQYIEKSPEDFMSDLYNVGKTKAVGYLPIPNINKYGNDTVENVIEWCKLNNLKYKIFTEKEGSTWGGALYVYDYNMLEKILEKHYNILQSANVPLNPDKYVDYIETNIVNNDLFPQAYKIIGLTFNDKRFRD